MLFGIIMLSVTLSIDALFAGFSYGLNGTRIPLMSKLIICAFSVVYCAVALLLGSTLAGVLPPMAAKIIGAAILAALGVFMIIKTHIKRSKKSKGDIGEESPKTLCRIIIKSLGITIEILKNNPEAGDIDASGDIDKKEAILLGFALSVDSLAAGFGSALSGLCSWYIPFAVGLCQLAFLSTGLGAGKYLSEKRRKLPDKYDSITSAVPGVLLIILSIFRFL